MEVIEFQKVIQTLSSIANLYIIVYCETESKSSDIYRQFQVDFKNIPLHRVLLHQTTVGEIAIVRQLNPKLCILYNQDAFNGLSKHVKAVIYEKERFSIFDLIRK